MHVVIKVTCMYKRYIKLYLCIFIWSYLYAVTTLNYKVIKFPFLQPFSYRNNKPGLQWNFAKRSQCQLGRERFLSRAPGSVHVALFDGQALKSDSPEVRRSVCRANWNERVLLCALPTEGKHQHPFPLLACSFAETCDAFPFYPLRHWGSEL